MKWSLQLARIAGIKIFIHWTFVILMVWIVFSQWQQGKSWDQVAMAAFFILIIFGCVVLHELGHALMARKFNIKTRDITLLPIGGLARLEKIPEEPKQELWVALAGPAVNIAISAVLLGYFSVFQPGDLNPQLLSLDQISADTFLVNLLMVNLFLALFNLIPAFPMDGGRVFRALLSFKFSRVAATRMAVALGQFVAIGFAFIGLLYNPILLLIAIFVYLGAQFELEQVQQKSMLRGYHVGDIMMRQYHTLQTRARLLDAVNLLLDSQEKDFVVMEGEKVAGLLNAQNIMQGLKDQQSDQPIAEVMSTNFRQLDPKEPLDQVFEELQLKKYSALPVVKSDRLVGVLNMDNIYEFIMIQNAMSMKGQEGAKWITH